MSPVSKKDARVQAVELFIQADGKITNVEIAKALQVHPLTIGRWKRADQWESELEERRKVETKEPSARVVRKKDARDKALQLYLDAGGKITNKELATQVRVSSASIGNWKAAVGWGALIQSKAREVEETVVAPEVIGELLKTEELVAGPPMAPRAPILELDELVAPAQITRINRRMDEMLRRSHLTSEDVANLARAKDLMLEAVMTYLALLQEMGTVIVRS
jgi:hypothetical protein